MSNILVLQKHKKSSEDFILRMQVLHNFILLFLLLSIYHHNGKTMAKGAYIGPIMMWWNLNDNGPNIYIYLQFP